jgi:hypothetical protein
VALTGREASSHGLLLPFSLCSVSLSVENFARFLDLASDATVEADDDRAELRRLPTNVVCQVEYS